MKNFENSIWFDDNVSRVQVLTMDHSGELLICFTDRHASMRFAMQPLDAELFASNILAAARSSQIKSAA
jgi:hypothetical protein